MLNLSQLNDIPLIDTHVHRVHPNRAGDFGGIAGGFIPGPNQEKHARQTLLYGMIMEALRKQFHLPENTEVEEIEAERHRRYQRDPQKYFADLVRSQNVDLYCVEVGSPFGGAAYTPEEIAYFHGSIPEDKCCAIVRIDRVLDELLPPEGSFEQFMQRYQEKLRESIAAQRTVGLKSCCAYNGGLNVEIVDAWDARRAFESLKLNSASPRERKVLFDFVLMDSAETAVELNLPIQIHTGAGGGNWLDFKTQNPIHLIDFLKDGRVKNRAKIVLLHGGHPHEEDTGYITAQFSNVYTDFSGTFYLCSAKGTERMTALLERTPLDKVMYGSDGVGFPELSWFSHNHFRAQLLKMLNQMVEGGYLTEKRAYQVAVMFMHDNALGCYERISDYL